MRVIDAPCRVFGARLRVCGGFAAFHDARLRVIDAHVRVCAFAASFTGAAF